MASQKRRIITDAHPGQSSSQAAALSPRTSLGSPIRLQASNMLSSFKRSSISCLFNIFQCITVITTQKAPMKIRTSRMFETKEQIRILTEANARQNLKSISTSEDKAAQLPKIFVSISATRKTCFRLVSLHSFIKSQI
jgi:hypothetical protein